MASSGQLCSAVAKDDNINSVESICQTYPKEQFEAEAGEALIIAARNGFTGYVETLLEHGADKNYQSADDGITALHAAARHRQYYCVAALIKAKADPTICDHEGSTALHAATEGGEIGCVQYMVQSGAIASAARKDGKTPVQLALEIGNVPLSEYLSVVANTQRQEIPHLVADH